ncbi:TOBE domain-containing protein, partial [Devosia nitrariae]
TMADKIVVLRDGVVEQVGSPLDLYDTPRTEFVAGFIGSPRMNFLAGERARTFDAARIGVRPEHIDIVADGPWSGTVTHVERLGSDTFVYLDLDQGGRLTVRLEGKTAIAQGEVVALGPTGPVHRFDGEGLAVSKGGGGMIAGSKLSTHRV